MNWLTELAVRSTGPEDRGSTGEPGCVRARSELRSAVLRCKLGKSRRYSALCGRSSTAAATSENEHMGASRRFRGIGGPQCQQTEYHDDQGTKGKTDFGLHSGRDYRKGCPAGQGKVS